MSANTIAGPSGHRHTIVEEPRSKLEPHESAKAALPEKIHLPETQVRTPSLKFYQLPRSVGSARNKVLRNMEHFFGSCICSPSSAEESAPSASGKARKSSSLPGKRTGKVREGTVLQSDYRQTMRSATERQNPGGKGKVRESPDQIRQKLHELSRYDSPSPVGTPDRSKPSAMTANSAEPPSVPQQHQSRRERLFHLLESVRPRFKSNSPEQPDAGGNFRLRTKATSANLNATAAAIKQDFWPNLLAATLDQLNSPIAQLKTINGFINNLDTEYENLASLVGQQNDGTSGPMRNMMTGLQGLAWAYQEGPIREGGMPPPGMQDLSRRADELLQMEIQPARGGEDALRFGQLGTTHTYDETRAQSTPGPRLARELDNHAKMNFKDAFVSLRSLRDDLEQLIQTLQTVVPEPPLAVTSRIANLGAEGGEGRDMTQPSTQDRTVTSSDAPSKIDKGKEKGKAQLTLAPVTTEAVPASQDHQPPPSVRSVYVRENSPELTQAGQEDLEAALKMYQEYKGLVEPEGIERKRVD